MQSTQNVFRHDISIHPSIFYTRLIQLSGRGGAGAYPSSHWARGGVYPGQVASSSQGHTETNETNNHTFMTCNFGDKKEKNCITLK